MPKLNFRLNFAAMFIALLGFAGGSPTVADDTGFSQPLTKVVDEFEAAWNTHDMDRFGDLFTDDANFVNVAGVWWKGRIEIQQAHRKSHDNQFKNSTLAMKLATARKLTGEIAILHVTWDLKGHLGPDGKPGAPRQGVMTMVCVLQGDVWKIEAAHNTDTRVPAPVSGDDRK